VKLFRIASTGATWSPDDLSGAGAAKSGGRWNDEGQFILYASPTRAMAVLETTAHIKSIGLPLNRYLVEIDVPDIAWNKRVIATPASLQGAWDSIPHGFPSVNFGSTWYKSGESALLEVPSVIVEEEANILINCTHPEVVDKMAAKIMRKFHYSQLLR